MKNITVTVDDETYRRARIKAAERYTSVSALVKQFLNELSGEDDFDRLWRKEQELRKQIRSFDGGDRLSRDEIYERRR
jgi:Arc/MetJ-type ribon-helix-helix transcriptional regulator